MVGSRANTHRWRGSIETDRGYRRRVAAAVDRDQFTEPGTNPNAMDHAKVARKQEARKAHG